MKAMPVSLLAGLLFAACGGDSPTHSTGTHTHADGTVDTDEPAAKPDTHAHSERIALGEVKIGEHTINVFQVAKIEPGKEGDFDLDFPVGKALPSTLRGWIGVESAQGSMKVRFEKETASRMHGHPEVPKSMPAGSMLWLEVESPSGTEKAAVSFRP